MPGLPGPVKDRQNVGPFFEDAYPIYEIDLLFEFDPDLHEEGVEFGIVLESKQHEQLSAVFSTRTQQVSIARNQSGKADFSVNFPGVHVGPYQVTGTGEIRFHAFIDLSSIELFVDDGALVLTELCFPESGFEQIHLYANKESVKLKTGTIYSLKSIW